MFSYEQLLVLGQETSYTCAQGVSWAELDIHVHPHEDDLLAACREAERLGYASARDCSSRRNCTVFVFTAEGKNLLAFARCFAEREPSA